MKFKRTSIFIISFLMFCGSITFFTGCNKTIAESDYAPKSYAEMNLLHKDGDGKNVDNYRDNYVSTPFFSSSEDSVTYTANAMYDIFTLANKWYSAPGGSGFQVVHRFGGSTPKYFEWMAQKSLWTDDTALKDYVIQTLVNYPIMSSGQLWTWHNSPRWPVSANVQNGSFHYDDQFRYISAIKQIISWQQSASILEAVDKTLYTAEKDDQGNIILQNEKDVSVNKTVKEKLDMCLKFIMENLNGKNGLIILPAENSGKRASKSSNYFDSYAYGNKSAYENQLFYHAIEDLISIEKFYLNELISKNDVTKTDEINSKITFYQQLKATVKTNYVKEFWDTQKKRFIATIDTDNVRWDFGMVTQNLEAVTYGIAAEQENDIMSWINGKRIIEGDTSNGEDIYEHKIAPRTNTLKIETSQIRENGEWKYWWHGMPEINPATNQKWNESQVNGGILFWTSYYDLMSRFKVLGAENAMNRFDVISDEYEVDLLMRDPANITGNKWKLGVIDEFPESGLVPLAYLNGMLGIDADFDGLKIQPKLPKAYDYAGVKKIVFGGNAYKITVYKDGKLIIEGENISLNIKYSPIIAGEYEAIYYGKNDVEILKEDVTIKNGVINCKLNNLNAIKVVIKTK